MLTALLSILAGPLIAVASVAAYLLLRRRTRRHPTTMLPGLLPPYVRVPRVNEDLCIGCEKCVAICPKDVLKLVHHKSTVVYQDQCISCQKCAEVCPTQALIMYKGGREPTREVVLPSLDEYYQSQQAPGLYLIGEAAGKPLIKNGVNLGRAVIEHMRVRGGLRPVSIDPIRPPQKDVQDLDVVIVGAGPAGLSAGMSCRERGLSYVVLERSDSAMATVMRYPKTKSVHAEPRDVRCVGLLPVWDCGTPELREEWNRIIRGVGLNLSLQTSADDVARDEASGAFLVKTRDMISNTAGRTYRAKRVVVAIGGLGVPRKLGRDKDIEGENIPMVRKVLDDAEKYTKQNILVIGGGDSAVESAVDLARPQLENRVAISFYKKESNLSCNSKNLGLLKKAIGEDRILPLFESNVLSFREGKTTLRIAQPGKEPPVRDKAIPTETVFVLIGGDPPRKWLEQIKIPYGPIQHDQFSRPPTDKLVEALIGHQPSNDQPGRPLPIKRARPEEKTLSPAALASQAATTTIVSDSDTAPQLEPPPEADDNPIKPAKATMIMRLPEKAQISGPTVTVAQALREGAITERPR